MKVWEEKQSLDSYLPEDYYDLNYNGRTKLSIFLIRYISINHTPVADPAMPPPPPGPVKKVINKNAFQ